LLGRPRPSTLSVPDRCNDLLDGARDKASLQHATDEPCEGGWN
jgi:hypothetical protein